MPIRPCWKPARRPAVLLLYLLLAGAGLGATEQFPGESAKWRRYQSTHFEMFSAARDGETRELLHKLEMLRSLLLERLHLQERQPQAVTIYYFNSRQDFRPYCQPEQKQELAGYYLQRPDRAVIVLSPAWGNKAVRSVIFHEYVHHLNRSLGIEPPLWYDEGVAELYSTVEFEKKGARLGKPQGWYLNILRRRKLLPLATLFSVDHQSPIYNAGQHSGLFYAESWAFLHYLQFGKNALDREKVRDFLAYAITESRTADPEARRQRFEECFGMDYAAMRAELDQYVETGSFYQRTTSARPLVADPATYECRPLTLLEIHERLADLGLRVNEMPAAKVALLNAVDTSPTKARIWEALGADAWMQNDDDRAKECWEKALEAGSHNPAIYHELGQMAGRRWFAQFNFDLRLTPEKARQLRALFKRSIDNTPEQFAAYEMLAWVEASVEQPDPANVDLVQSRLANLPNKARTVVALAMVRMHVGDPEGAKKILAGLEPLRPDYWSAVAGEAILARVEKREPRKIEPPDAQAVARPQFRLRGPELPRK